MQIKRTTATKIMSRAISSNSTCLLAVLDENEAIHYAANESEFHTLTTSHPNAIWVHNQNPMAIECMEQLTYADGQFILEVFQDTEGVFGLRAYQMIGKMQTPVLLELEEIRR